MAMTEVFVGAKRYKDEFKLEAVRQVTDQGHRVAEVAERLGITACSLYAWKTRFGKGEVVRRVEQDQSAEVRRLKAELRRVTEERDILKMLGIQRSGYYARRRSPHSTRAKEDQRLLRLIANAWLERGPGAVVLRTSDGCLTHQSNLHCYG